MKSLKTKFILVLTSLIVIAILTTAGVLVQQKKSELEGDIYFNARSFAELSSQKIIELTEQNLKQDNFIFFLRDLNALLKNNADIASVKIYEFTGNTIFDSTTEQQKQYIGEPRQVTNPSLLQRIKSANPSILNTDNQVYFLDQVSPGNYEIISDTGQRLNSENEKPTFNNLQNLVFTVNNEYAIEYNITYQNLTARLLSSAYQILLIALIAIVVSIIIGYILSSIVTNPLKKLTAIVDVIAKGDFAARAEVKSEDEVGKLAESVNHMAGDLEQATEAKIYKEKIKKELEIAAKIQKEILPTTLPTIKGLDIAAQVIPATEVGGDVYDVLLDTENTPYFYVGDVTGHGVPAGLISSVTNAVVISTLELKDPVKIVANLNKTLKHKSAANLFVTILLARYTNNAIEYVSAGHEKSIFYSASKKTAEYLPPAGIALGLFEDISDKLKLESVKFEPGDIFITYTDGIPEAWQSDTEKYGEERFLQAALTAINAHSSATEIKDAILTEVKSFMGNYEQKDDITLIVVKCTT